MKSSFKNKIGLNLYITLFLCLSSSNVNSQTLKLDQGKLQYAQEVKSEALLKKDSLQLAEAYYLLGKVYGATADYKTAQGYYKKSMDILSPKGPSFELGRLFLRLSDIEFMIKHYPESIEYAQRALIIFQTGNSEKGIHLSYGAFARVSALTWITLDETPHKKVLYDSIVGIHNKSLRYFIEAHDTLGQAESRAIIGNLMVQNNQKGGFFHLIKAYQTFGILNKKHSQLTTLITLVNSSIKFGNLPKAYEYLQKAMDIYREEAINENYTDQNLTETNIAYYKAVADWKKVTDWQEKLLEIVKRDADIDRQGAISRLNIEFETERRENQLKVQEQNIRLQSTNIQNRNSLLGILLIFLLGAVWSSQAFYKLYIKNKAISRQNEDLVKEQNHRVKNNLQLISSLLYLQANRLTDEKAKIAVEESQLRIEIMAALQRKLYEGENLTSLVTKDLVQEIVEIILQTFDLGNVNVTYKIDPTLQLSADQSLHLSLILNELTTNSCKYAFPKHPKPTLMISCSHQHNVFSMSFNDNGLSNKKIPSLSSTTSFGMRLVQMQAEQIGAEYLFRVNNGLEFKMNFKII